MTTDSDHNYPIFPDLAKNMMREGPNQLWVADFTYVAIANRFCIWLQSSMPGPAGRRSCHQPLIDARLAVAALKAAISTESIKGLRASFRPWITICLRRLSRRLARARFRGSMARRWQSLRERESRELHEDTEG